MAEKTFKGRIVQKHDVEANWLLATNFTPMKGEIIVYDIDDNYSYERLKIGDGVQNVNDLPFYAGSWNDLNDKPFGEESNESILEISKDEIFNDGYGTLFTDAIDAPFILEEGKTYEVIYDGVPYTCTAVRISNYHVSVGNTSMAGRPGTNTGEPFYIDNYYEVSSATGYISNSWTIYVDAQENHTVVASNMLIKTLDEKYIPETIARVVDIYNHNIDTDAHSDIRDAINAVSALVGDTSVSSQISTAVANKSDVGHNHDSDYDAKGAADTALTNAKDYTDAEITEWVGGTTVAEQISTAIAGKSDSDHTHSSYVNQNAFSNVTVGSTTIAADSTTDTLTLVAGSNVTITTDATNDKVTFAVADGSTSAKGVVQLTNSTSSTSTTTAATPSSVKSAYDLANTAKTNAATAQTRADNAYALAESKVDSLSDLGITATAAELNYVDGVTSNIQTQLDGKAASSHNHSASNITSGTLSSDRLPIVPIAKGGTNASTAAVARDNLGFTYGSAEPTGTPDTGEGSVYFRIGGDAIVEVGTSGIWTYRKFASGIAECWGSYTFTATISSASGSNYYAKLSAPEDYPFTFTSAPQQFTTLQSGPYAAWLEINASSDSWPSTTSPGYQMLASTLSRASGSYTVAYHVIGRWK